MTNDDGTHEDVSKPDPLSAGARAADAAGKRALVMLAMPHVLVIAGIGMAAVAGMLVVTYAAGAQIAVWHGWARWLAAACAIAMVVTLASFSRSSPMRRTFAWSGSADARSSVLAGLTSRSEWVWRLATAPVAALGGLGFLRWGLPVMPAAALAAVAWASVDLSTVATYRSRRRLHQLIGWIGPSHRTGHPARWRIRLSAVPADLAEQDRALLDRMAAVRMFLEHIERSPMVARDGQISPAVLHGAGGLLALLGGDLIRRADTLNRQAGGT